MNKAALVLIATLTLTSCSAITGAVKSMLSDDGISVDAQVGSNENKVKTGIGSIKGKTNSVENETDSGNIDTNSGEWHIESGKDVNVTVYDTSIWTYILLVFMFVVSIFRPWIVRKLGGDRK